MPLYTDLTYLKELTDNDEELIRQSLQRYLATSPEQTRKLVESAQEKDWTEIHNTAHSLFATTQIVGLKAIAQDLKDIQRISREEKDEGEINRRVEKINRVVQQSLSELKNYIAERGNQ